MYEVYYADGRLAYRGSYNRCVRYCNRKWSGCSILPQSGLSQDAYATNEDGETYTTSTEVVRDSEGNAVAEIRPN